MSENQQPTGNFDPMAVGLMGLASVGALTTAAYLKFHAEIVAATLALRHAELSVVSLFTDRYADLDASVLNPDLSKVGILSLLKLGSIVGATYNIPGAILLAGAAALTFCCAPDRRYRSKIDSLDTLIMAGDHRFRYARAFVGRKRTLRNPAWGQRPQPGDMSLHTPEWIAAYATDRNGFNEDLARAAFAAQLGSMWLGVTDAPAHVRCLFAAFALHANRSRDDAARFLGDLAVSLPPSNGDAPLTLPPDVGAQAAVILQDMEMIAPCVQIASRHAYTAPALMGVLLHARDRAGVLNPGLFAWLKLVDRTLWYALVMPPNPYVEAAGAQAHFLAETIAEAPIFTPQIEPALEATRAGDHQNAVTEQRRC